MKIKICGLFREEDIEYANEVKPDYIGFVFAKSRRQISYEQAKQLKAKLDEGIVTVGVYVDAPVREVVKCLEHGIIDVAQLHGNETEEDIQYIKAVTCKPVIKAIKVKQLVDIEAWLDSSADYLLLDNGQGTGQSFDWNILHDINILNRKFFLAGGIHADNIQDAILSVSPYCIDVSSGAETNGLKDINKMRKLTEKVRITNSK